MDRILIIQTAFIGDVVLATALVEKLNRSYPSARVDFLLRKGNESLLDNHPGIGEVLVWDKKKAKYLGLLRLAHTIRQRRYDLVVNLQRYFSTGLLTACAGGRATSGFDKNPLSFFFSHRTPHVFGTPERPLHEVERNLALLSQWTDDEFVRPKVYPRPADYDVLRPPASYITLSPASVWPTKQWPAEKWVKLLDSVERSMAVYLLGGKGDRPLCESIKKQTAHPNTTVLAGSLSFLQSAALMHGAAMNFVNDSAPLHLASAVDAPVTVVFCSTVPSFGFGPLSSRSHVVETRKKLHCRPCGLHGKKACPLGHFNCADIEVGQVLEKLNGGTNFGGQGNRH